MVFCAKNLDEVVRTRDAADFASVTRQHTHQIGVQLVRVRLLEGIRSQQGGIRLGRRASHIIVGEAVRLMEPTFSSTETPGRRSVFDSVFKEAMQAAFDTFDAFTIADLAEQGSTARLAYLNCEARIRFRAPSQEAEVRRVITLQAIDSLPRQTCPPPGDCLFRFHSEIRFAWKGADRIPLSIGGMAETGRAGPKQFVARLGGVFTQEPEV